MADETKCSKTCSTTCLYIVASVVTFLLMTFLVKEMVRITQPAPVGAERAAARAGLLGSPLFALIATVKLHAPTVLANCTWLTYGHTRPAANDAFVYGFASQAGLAVALWILCRLGRTTLVGIIPVGIASVFW